ncbi:hypothetical protein MMC25_002820 [Agyrium rufum]|nr:hypothetical protein [Agyrium rufum]
MATPPEPSPTTTRAIPKEIPAQTPPPLHIPPSTSTCAVHILNTTCDVTIPSTGIVSPTLPGHTIINLPTFSFLIQNRALGKNVLFDLGSRKDWWNLSPVTANGIEEGIPGLRVTKGVDEVLADAGFDVEKVDVLIWSHWHWDHTGDPSKFPKSADLIVGPGFKQELLPGFPADRDSRVLESDFEGRNVREISFDEGTYIGNYRSHDLFGDGSLYILDTPGHAIGHIAALARTTPDTFVFVGGDLCHYGGIFRPTPYAPLPSTFTSSIPLLKQPRYPNPCPCTIFTDIHPLHSSSENLTKARTTPFFRVPSWEGNYYHDPAQTQQTADTLQAFDGNEDVFVCLAHDPGLVDVVKFFPDDGDGIGNFKQLGLKMRAQWGWLADLPINGEAEERTAWVGKPTKPE